MKGYTLVITEKPDAAARIAAALDADGNPERMVDRGVPYYMARRSESIVVVPALGHLYTVASEAKGTEHYPVFDCKWVPMYMAKREAKRTRAWLQTIGKLAKNADAFIDACDFDIEGSIIGYCILRYACGGKENVAKRMKYSTLTREEVEKSFVEALPNLDFRLIEAGLAKHEVDWLYGVNLSRALTIAAKKASGSYATLSTGRVQGPTLKFLATRERSIRSFVPSPYWKVRAAVRIGSSVFEIDYEKNVLEIKDEAQALVTACEGKNGKIEKIETRKSREMPPPPFDLSSLQNEAYRLFRYNPMRTSNIAQHLYLDALISYPRTSSQKLPSAIGYETILRNLSRSREHETLAKQLLAKPELKPTEGKNRDPAHPAIYPTGNLPERALDNMERNIWTLVVRRFMAVFGDPAVQQSVKATVDIGGNRFYFTAEETLEEGWFRFYKPYVQSETTPLPSMKVGQEVTVEKLILAEKFTQPPPRYNPGSLLRRMQREEIGTKATRAGIMQTLYDRNYIREERMLVTELGFEVIHILKKYCPTVVSTELTRKLEERMGEIQEGKETREDVFQEAVEILKPSIEKLREKERIIGAHLIQALRKSKLEERVIGACPTCKNGNLLIVQSRKTGKRFVGCTGYFEGKCKTAFPLPQRGFVKPSSKVCRSCGWPTVRVWMRNKLPWNLCFNPTCPLKARRSRNVELQSMQ